jgi:hypothetical protein
MCHVFRCDTPARQIANTLRDICKQIMLQRNIQNIENSTAGATPTGRPAISRPNNLPNLEKVHGEQKGQEFTFETLLKCMWRCLKTSVFMYFTMSSLFFNSHFIPHPNGRAQESFEGSLPGYSQRFKANWCRSVEQRHGESVLSHSKREMGFCFCCGRPLHHHSH